MCALPPTLLQMCGQLLHNPCFLVLQASVGRSMEQLEQRAKALDKQMADTRLDVQMLRNQVADMQVGCV